MASLYLGEKTKAISYFEEYLVYRENDSKINKLLDVIKSGNYKILNRQ